MVRKTVQVIEKDGMRYVSVEGKYNLHYYLASNLERAKRMIKKDYDLVICIDGMERSGKSVLAQQIGYYLDRTLTIDRITFTAEEFKKAVSQAKPNECIILDEAMTALFSRASMSKTNIDIVRLLAEVGQKNLVIIIVLPSFFVLDQYAAVHRSRCLIHTYTKKLQRGYFRFYSMKNKKQLYLMGKKGYNYGAAKPNFRGWFSGAYAIDEKEYRKKKADSLIKNSGGDELKEDEFDIKTIALILRKVGMTARETRDAILENFPYHKKVPGERTIQRWSRE